VGRFIFASHFYSSSVKGRPSQALVFREERYLPSWSITWVATRGGGGDKILLENDFISCQPYLPAHIFY
jgi:hypothetical protein